MIVLLIIEFFFLSYVTVLTDIITHMSGSCKQLQFPSFYFIFFLAQDGKLFFLLTWWHAAIKASSNKQTHLFNVTTN